MDKTCATMRERNMSLKDKTVYLVGEFMNTRFSLLYFNCLSFEEYLIHSQRICYPENVAETGKGWCATQEPGQQGMPVGDHSEYDSGWGFCSTHPTQDHCHEHVGAYQERDPTPKRVSVFPDSFCKKRLGENLAYEQPNVKENEYQDLRSVSV